MMKKKMRLLSLILCVLLIASIFPTLAFALGDSENDSDLISTEEENKQGEENLIPMENKNEEDSDSIPSEDENEEEEDIEPISSEDENEENLESNVSEVENEAEDEDNINDAELTSTEDVNSESNVYFALEEENTKSTLNVNLSKKENTENDLDLVLPSEDEIKADGVNYGTAYTHIDVKVDGEYTVSIDGNPLKLAGELQPDTIKVKIGNTTYDFSKYSVSTVTEDGRKEYEIRVRYPYISPDSIAWVEGTYRMTNVYVSGRMLFTSIPENIQSVLPTTTVNEKTYYYVDIENFQYNGVNECTGGNGLRSGGHTGTPTGLDLFIQASGMSVILTKGRLAIKKVLVDETGDTLVEDATFDYVITDKSTGEKLFFVDGVYSESTAEGASSTVSVPVNTTVLLEGIPAGTYKITEIQKDGYVIFKINGNETSSYTTDYVIKIKEDEEVPVATFTNMKLSSESAIRLNKTADGVADAFYPNPTISIYATENGQKVGDALWNGMLPTNGDVIYPTTYFGVGTYLIEETGYELAGYDCTASLNQSPDMTFVVSAGGSLITLTIHNQYKVHTPNPASVVIEALKTLDGVPATGSAFTFVLTDERGNAVRTTNNDGSIAFDALTFSEEGTYVYTLREEMGADPNILYDDTEYTISIEVTLDGDYLAHVTVTKNQMEYEKTPEFANQTKTGGLTVSKIVSGGGASTTQPFTFTVTLSTDDGTSITGEKIYGGVTFINGEARFSLKHGESKTITGIPAGYRYLVEESDNAGYIVRVNNTDSVAAKGTIEPDKETAVSFNNYKGAGNPAIVNISAMKMLDGAAPSGSDFTFILTDEYGNTVQTVNNDGSNITFDTLSFSEEGTYRYTVKEVAGSDETIIYDNAVYTIMIYVTLSDSYQAEVTYKKDGAAYDGQIAFANKTKDVPLPAKTVSVSVNKVWIDGYSERRPSAVTVQLYRNNSAYGDAVTLNESNNWSYVWAELDEGYTYTVDEVNCPGGYTKKVEHSGNAWTITNTVKRLDDVPQTSDSSHLGLWITLAILSVFGVVFVLLYEKMRYQSRRRER